MSFLKKLFNRIEENIIPNAEVANIVTIMALSEKFLEKSKEEANIQKVESSDIILEEMSRLSDIGLVNSKNYQMLKEKFNKILEDRENHKRAIRILEEIKEIHNKYPKSIIMGIKVFESFLSKHHLTFGLIDDYTGTIPENNIQEISEYRQSLKNNHDELFYKTGNGIYEIREIHTWDDDYKKTITNYFETTNYLVIPDFKVNKGDYADFVYFNLKTNKLQANEDEYTVKIKVSECVHNQLFIACPAKDLKPQPLKFIEKPVDPIVFSVIDGIIVIHSVWGEEAESKVIQDYIEYNKLFDRL